MFSVASTIQKSFFLFFAVTIITSYICALKPDKTCTEAIPAENYVNRI